MTSQDLMDFPITNRHGEPIVDLAGWEKLASPGRARWKDGHSAKELARLWLSGQGPEQLKALLDQQPETAGLAIEAAVAEKQTHFDDFGGPRNHDLLVVAEAAGGRTIVAIEAKATEPLGETLKAYRDGAQKRRDAGEATNAPARLENLVRAIVGSSLVESPELIGLRYQLFSALAGTLAAAQEEGAAQAVLCIQQLRTSLTRDEQVARNRKDIETFLEVAFSGAARIESGAGWITPPLTIREGGTRFSSATPFHLAELVTPL
jgi:hypothetical protein